MSDDGDRDVPARVRGFDAAVRFAVERAPETSHWKRRFDSSDVQRRAAGDVPDRTMRRALNDAKARGWVEKSRQRWEPGERAEQVAPEDDGGEKVTVCEDCTEVWAGLTTHCEECGSEAIRQVEPREI